MLMPRTMVAQPDLSVFRAEDSTRVVAGTGIGADGSDSNSGLSALKPMATIANAYAALPSRGGTIILLDGKHDVVSGFVATSTKPVIFRSLNLVPPQVYTAVISGAPYLGQPTVWSSTGAARLLTFGGPAGGGQISKGCGCYGIGFDMLAVTTITGIMALDINHVRVIACNSWGDGTTNKYMLRSDTVNFDDVSWYRLRDNYSRNSGLCYLNESGGGNNNNNQIQDNVIFGPSPWGIVSDNTQRSAFFGNNIEGGRGILLTGASHYNHIEWNGGEAGGALPYLQFDSGAWGNTYDLYGAIGGGSDSSPVVNDLAITDGNGAYGNAGIVKTQGAYSNKTSSFTVPGGGTYPPNYMFDCNSASTITATFDRNASVPIGLGSTLMFRQSGVGQVVLAPFDGAVTLHGRLGLKTAGQYAVLNAQKIGTNEWAVWGDATA